MDRVRALNRWRDRVFEYYLGPAAEGEEEVRPHALENALVLEAYRALESAAEGMFPFVGRELLSWAGIAQGFNNRFEGQRLDGDERPRPRMTREMLRRRYLVPLEDTEGEGPAISSVGEVSGSSVGEVSDSSVGEVSGSSVGEISGSSVGEVSGSSVGEVSGRAASEIQPREASCSEPLHPIPDSGIPLLSGSPGAPKPVHQEGSSEQPETKGRISRLSPFVLLRVAQFGGEAV